VLFAISAAELMKKRSEVWSANIHGEELSQRRAPTSKVLPKMVIAYSCPSPCSAQAAIISTSC
jgi:hypothetical protein